MSEQDPTGKAIGAKARAAKLSPERRSEIAREAAAAKKRLAAMPRATHASQIKIGEVEIPCYVLDDGRRVLSTRGIMGALGRTWRGRKYSGTELPVFLEAKNLLPFVINDLDPVLTPVEFVTDAGAKAEGIPAEGLPAVCDIYLQARQSNKLTAAQMPIAQQCELLVRGFARVGIIALVDEATGYQKDRAKDALAKILEQFVAKELQPYVHTFPADYYEQLFKLYNLPFPPEGNKSWRPSFMGRITNEVVYNRLAPSLLPELKKLASKAEKRSRLHQWLTQELGHPKLREHLSSIVTIMKLSKTPAEFRANVDAIHPRFGDTAQLDFES